MGNVADIRFVSVPDSESVDIRFGWGDFDGKGGIGTNNCPFTRASE